MRVAKLLSLESASGVGATCFTGIGTGSSSESATDSDSVDRSAAASDYGGGLTNEAELLARWEGELRGATEKASLAGSNMSGEGRAHSGPCDDNQVLTAATGELPTLLSNANAKGDTTELGQRKSKASTISVATGASYSSRSVSESPSNNLIQYSPDPVCDLQEKRSSLPVPPVQLLRIVRRRLDDAARKTDAMPPTKVSGSAGNVDLVLDCCIDVSCASTSWIDADAGGDHDCSGAASPTVGDSDPRKLSHWSFRTARNHDDVHSDYKLSEVGTCLNASERMRRKQYGVNVMFFMVIILLLSFALLLLLLSVTSDTDSAKSDLDLGGTLRIWRGKLAG